MNHSKTIIPIAAALGALLVAPTTRSEEPLTLPEITVTASPTTDAGYVATQSATGTKTDTRLIETPQTINVITVDEFTARAAQNVGQALLYTPGVNSQPFGGGVGLRNDDPVLRGFPAPLYLMACDCPHQRLVTNNSEPILTYSSASRS